jgi:hypothetical protein
MVSGAALKATVGGIACTATLALAVALPLLFLTVMVYVVVLVGVIVMEPLTGTLPIPLLMEAEVAPVDVQVRVEEPPATILAGEAEILTIGLAAWILIAKLANKIAPNLKMPGFLVIFSLLFHK